MFSTAMFGYISVVMNTPIALASFFFFFFFSPVRFSWQKYLKCHGRLTCSGPMHSGDVVSNECVQCVSSNITAFGTTEPTDSPALIDYSFCGVGVIY